MPLTKEDGSGVEGADTFVTVTEMRTFALKRGTTLAQTDSVVEAALVKAMDLIESHEDDFAGTRQFTLPFPRTDSPYAEESTVPEPIANAQCFAALESLKGVDLMPSQTGQRVKRTKVDVVEKEFFSGEARTVVPAFISLIQRFFRTSTVTVDRV